MSRRQRVVWSEGLLLSPQHLQQQDRYHEERGSELFRVGRTFPHGFSALELDEESIHNGQIVLHRAAGVLSAGTPFALPDRDLPPAGRSVDGHFPMGETEVPVFLGLRVHRPGQAEVAETSPGTLSDARYAASATKLIDEVGGETEREVSLARTNLRVLFSDENPGDYEALPLARIVRKAEGGFAYRSEYIPPCLAIQASPYVVRVLRRLLEILIAKSNELSDRRRFSGKGVAEFGRDDTAGFWLLGTINGFIPVLGHCLRASTVHPETVYVELARLAGMLTTLSDLQVRDIPPYDHDNAALAFGDLAGRIPRLLETVLPRHYTRIPLTRRDDLVHVGRIEDDRLLDPAMAFYLGVYANVSASDLQASFPEVTKIASPDKVEFLVQHALKGMGLRLAQTLPPAVPVQSGYVYFQLEKIGDAWDGIAGSRNLAIYVPAEFPGILLELVAVRE
jgi:type VI secretion system protein ImpJ